MEKDDFETIKKLPPEHRLKELEKLREKIKKEEKHELEKEIKKLEEKIKKEKEAEILEAEKLIRETLEESELEEDSKENIRREEIEDITDLFTEEEKARKEVIEEQARYGIELSYRSIDELNEQLKGLYEQPRWDSEAKKQFELLDYAISRKRLAIETGEYSPASMEALEKMTESYRLVKTIRDKQIEYKTGV